MEHQAEMDSLDTDIVWRSLKSARSYRFLRLIMSRCEFLVDKFYPHVKTGLPGISPSATFEKTAGYFDKNRERMRYDKFRKQGLFIGPGVVEAGCKSVIGKRLKQSGMHWSVRSANSIIALRCCLESGRFEDYWEQRQAA